MPIAKCEKGENMEFLINGIMSVTPQQIIMWIIGAILIYLAIAKELEPSFIVANGLLSNTC